jgi:hypothetical protein
MEIVFNDNACIFKAVLCAVYVTKAGVPSQTVC